MISPASIEGGSRRSTARTHHAVRASGAPPRASVAQQLAAPRARRDRSADRRPESPAPRTRSGPGRAAPTTSRSMPAITTSRTQRAETLHQRARSGPTLTQVPVASLKSSRDAPVEGKPASARSAGSIEAQRVAEAVEAFLVEGGAASASGVAPIAGGDVRAAHPRLQLALDRRQLQLAPRQPAGRRRRTAAQSGAADQARTARFRWSRGRSSIGCARRPSRARARRSSSQTCCASPAPA